MDYPVSIVTGPPGGGKSYAVVRRLVREIFPFFEDLNVVTNIPMWHPEDPNRVVVMEFEKGWVPPGDTLEERLQWGRNKIVVIDEAQEVLTKESEQTWREVLGKARKNDTRWVFMSQSRDNLWKWLDDLAELWTETKTGSSLRDENFGFRILDIQNVIAKLTGKFHEYFLITEYTRKNRRWCPIDRRQHKEWFDKKVGDCYDTKNGQNIDEQGNAVVLRDYQRLTWPKLLWVVASRNWHCVPLALMKVGFPIVMIVGGLGMLLYMTGATLWSAPKTPVPVATVAERAVRSQVERQAPGSTGPVAPAAPAGPPPVPVRRRVARW